MLVMIYDNDRGFMLSQSYYEQATNAFIQGFMGMGA